MLKNSEPTVARLKVTIGADGVGGGFWANPTCTWLEAICRPPGGAVVVTRQSPGDPTAGTVNVALPSWPVVTGAPCGVNAPVPSLWNSSCSDAELATHA